MVYCMLFVMPDPEMGYRISVILKECSVCNLPEIFTLVGKVFPLSENFECKRLTISACCSAVIRGPSVIKVAANLGEI